MKEYTSYDPYGTYETKGEDPYSILMRMSSWNKEIRSTISDVQESLAGTIERQSQIIQNVDSISLNVFDITTSLDDTIVRVGEIEIRSDAIDITVAAVDSRLGAAEGRITTMAGEIALKASASVVTALGTRMNTAEININANAGAITQKVSSTDYNGSTIVSLIHQAPSYITIAANRINLIGAVTVLSDISGNLGTITSGNINIYNDINVGAGVYMRGSSRTGIYFGSWSQIYDNSGRLTLEGYNGINLVGSVIFSQSINFGNQYVSGASYLVTSPNGDGIALRYSTANGRLYVDRNGSQIGFVTLT